MLPLVSRSLMYSGYTTRVTYFMDTNIPFILQFEYLLAHCAARKMTCTQDLMLPMSPETQVQKPVDEQLSLSGSKQHSGWRQRFSKRIQPKQPGDEVTVEKPIKKKKTAKLKAKTACKIYFYI